MKQIVPLLCLAVAAAPLAPVSASAHDLLASQTPASHLSYLALTEPAVVIKAGYVPRKGDRQDQDGRRNGGDDRGENRRDGGDDRGENRRDDRMSEAIAVASRRGDYINAWPAGGSVFRVRVSTPQGRKDVYVDVNCRCIVREE
ncbi:hypothetical protein [Asticcacaulis sp. 201]|uniref:hypothetical protein n=1 Tax=Asticcacaulis sp. 201 TaxID=3028787 RepID=UPI002915DA7D|nr:hypothetical protein [Asticcacaulis sp. 201]MDV6331909.1 hypothetical protein [Asticcacaulis sp. 201]